MTDTVDAIVLGDHRVHHEVDGHKVVSTASDGVVKMTKGAFEDSAKFGAVRKPTEVEISGATVTSVETPVVDRSPAVRESQTAEVSTKGRRD